MSAPRPDLVDAKPTKTREEGAEHADYRTGLSALRKNVTDMRILCGFLQGDEFGFGKGQSLRFQQ